MNRLSGEKWEKEQSQDTTSLPPITLDTIEKGIVYQDIRTMLGNEHGRSNYNTISDEALCQEIDMVILPSIGKLSVYEISHETKEQVARHLHSRHHVSMEKIARCLAMKQAK